MTRAVRAVARLAALATVCGVLLGAIGASIDVAPARADGPPTRRDPWVGYAYPAGGRVGTTVQVSAGGQNLAGAASAIVTGEGVRARVVRHRRPLSVQQLRELRFQLADIRDARAAAAAGKAAPAPRPRDEFRADLPDAPPFDRLAKLSADELLDVAARYLEAPERRQQNAQLAESVDLEVEIDPGAAPGERELRLRTPRGLSNPLRFQVGTRPESLEEEDWGRPRQPPRLELPVLVNGQILPGDADRFRFHARRGQRLVVETRARSLVPFLADAVPGWFQPVVSIRDEEGREIAYGDDWRFDPDPVVPFQAPTDGEYVLEVRDALWRGREDFVYRLTVSEARPAPHAPAATAASRASATLSDPPECGESEPDDDAAHAQPVPTPTVVRGRIDRPGDVDLFVFEGAAGDDVVAEVVARRDGSPLDSVLRLFDARGRVLAWNDDFDDRAPGVSTHHADSRLRATLPSGGAWFVRIADAQGHGGPEHAYRLRVGPPRPDFEVAATPSSLAAVAGRAVPFRAHVVRKDGFAGDVELALDGAPLGFTLGGARIPAGRDDVRMTLHVPPDAPDGALEIRLVAKARIAGADVVRDVLPTEDRMQAFAYRHLVPAQALVLAVSSARGAATAAAPALAAPVRLPAGGVATADLLVPGIAFAAARAGLTFALDAPPPGVVLEKWSVVPDGIVLTLRAKPGEAFPGPADNLIVEVLADPPPARGAGRAGRAANAGAERRVSIGYLPAVPVEIVAK